MKQNRAERRAAEARQARAAAQAAQSRRAEAAADVRKAIAQHRAEARRAAAGRAADTTATAAILAACMNVYHITAQATQATAAQRRAQAAARLARAEAAERQARETAAAQAAQQAAAEQRRPRRAAARLNPAFTAAELDMRGYADLAAAIAAQSMTAEQAEAEARRRETQAAAEARRQAEQAAQAAAEARAADGRRQAQQAAEAAHGRRPQAARLNHSAEQATEAAAITAEQAEAAGYHTIAARLRRGTATQAEAARLAARLDTIAGRDFTSAYTAEQAIKGAVRAMHSAENFSGGMDMLRELAQQAERAAAIHSAGRPYTEQARAAADSKAGAAAETLPDIWDMIQASAAAVLEHGQVMTARGGTPLQAAGKNRGGRRQAVAVVETYGRTHSAATEAARKYSRAQADRAARQYVPDFQMSDREQATEAAAIAATEAIEQAIEQAAGVTEFDVTTDATQAAARLAATQGQFAADVAAVLINWPQIAEAAGHSAESAAAMPSNRQLAAVMGTEAARPYISTETAIYAATAQTATVARRIDRALQNIAQAREAATVAAELREAVAAQHSGRAYIIA